MNHHTPLPDLLDQVANAVGIDVALKLAAARGGTKVYIPARVTEHHWLAKLIGHATAQTLVEAITSDKTGLHMDIPMGPSRDQVSRWKHMHALIDKGLPTMEIARACGVHFRTVRRHRNQRADHSRVMAQLAQLSLFD
jgi:ActR/RegA family two-component response regulator